MEELYTLTVLQNDWFTVVNQRWKLLDSNTGGKVNREVWSLTSHDSMLPDMGDLTQELTLEAETREQAPLPSCLLLSSKQYPLGVQDELQRAGERSSLFCTARRQCCAVIYCVKTGVQRQHEELTET